MRKGRRDLVPQLLCSGCFALCFYAFMLIEAFVNEGCAVIFGSGAVNTLYALGLVCTGAGFLSFPLLCRACKGENSRKAALLIAGGLCLAAAAVLTAAARPAAFLLSSAAALLLTGHIGGWMYHTAAVCFAGSRYTGRMIGSGMGASIFLQFIVQDLTPCREVFLGSVFLSLAFALCFMVRAMKGGAGEKPLPAPSRGRGGRESAAALVAAVALMSLAAGMIDSVLTSFNAEKAYDIYGGVRLLYGLGLILAGFVADIKERSYLPLATVCAVLLSSVCMFFLSEEVGYFAGTALMYLYSGFYAVFLTVMFLDYAPKSGCPELWAGMGRIVRSFTVAATVLPALKVYDAAGSTVLAAGSCLASIGVLLALLPHIGHAVAAWERGGEDSGRKESSPREKLALYAQSRALTPRETEVLERLLTTEEDLQGIADSMYISRRMVQRYVSSIYEKTETKTRLGLFQSYISFTAD